MARKWVYRIEGRPGHERKVTKAGNVVQERVLSLNARPGHWGVVRRVKEHDENMVQLATRHYKPEAPLAKANVRIILHWHGKHRRDPDNQGGLMKGVLDGLVKGGVLADDSFDVIQAYAISIVQTVPPEDEHYVIIVEEVE